MNEKFEGCNEMCFYCRYSDCLRPYLVGEKHMRDPNEITLEKVRKQLGLLTDWRDEIEPISLRV